MDSPPVPNPVALQASCGWFSWVFSAPRIFADLDELPHQPSSALGVAVSLEQLLVAAVAVSLEQLLVAAEVSAPPGRVGAPIGVVVFYRERDAGHSAERRQREHDQVERGVLVSPADELLRLPAQPPVLGSG